MFVGVRQRKRAPVAPSAGSAPCPIGPSLEPQAQGACAEGGAQALGRCSQRLRRAAASLARTDAIIASPRQTPREFRSPHGDRNPIPCDFWTLACQCAPFVRSG